jgi:hypothetical protein
MHTASGTTGSGGEQCPVGGTERNDILISRVTDGVKGNVTPDGRYRVTEHGWRLRKPKSGLGRSLLGDQCGESSWGQTWYSGQSTTVSGCAASRNYTSQESTDSNDNRRI